MTLVRMRFKKKTVAVDFKTISFENFRIWEIVARKSDFAVRALTIIFTHAHIADTICIKNLMC